MIPTLYSPIEREFTTNGLGKLSGAVECNVTKERNGIYDLTMKYAVNAPHSSEITEGCIIVASHGGRKHTTTASDNYPDLQPFRIQNVKRESKYITVETRHDAMVQLAKLPVWPYPSGSITVEATMEHLSNLAQTWAENYPASGLHFETDIEGTIIYDKKLPRFALAFLAGQEGSVVDKLGGGELAYDWYNVRLAKALGHDMHMRISYGKNISEITGETFIGECYTGAYIYYQGENGIKYAKAYNFDMGESISRYMPNLYEMDISSEFDSEPQTEEAFLNVANARAAAMEAKEPWTNIFNNISVSWYELSNMSEFSNLQNIQLELGDYVDVYYPPLGIDKKVEIVKTTWNVLKDRYETIELNELKKSIHGSLVEMIQKQIRRA